MNGNSQKLHTLELIRAIAAVSVLIGHADYIPVAQGIKSGVTLWNGFPSLGVNLFFVLSGFVIYHVHGKHLGMPNETRNYLWRRFVRIWPLYAVLTIADAVIKPILLGGQSHGITEIAASLLFLELQVHPIVGVGWTLNHEAFFYLVFSFCIIFPKRLTVALLSIFATLLISRLYEQNYVNELTTWIFSSYRWHFICGIIAAAWFGNGLDNESRRKSRRFSLFAVSVLSILCLIGIFNSASHSKLYSVLATPLMIGTGIAISVHVEKKYNLTIPKIILYLGAVSYSLYLTHSTIIYVGLKFIHSKHKNLIESNVDLVMIILGLLALLAAFACHEWLEKPLLRLLKNPPRIFTA